MISLMAKLKCQSLWEFLLIPSFIYFFQKLYPFSKVNNNKEKLAAAAGGFILCRSSIFKKQFKEKIIITSVCFVLHKPPHKINTDYDPLKNALKGKKNTIQNIANAVINVRKSKLPDPSKMGNSGSFFKNPIINKDKFLELKNKYPDIPNFFEPYNKIKIPAAWLIEKIGYKGKRFGHAGIHNKQALVIVNYGNAEGSDILMLANQIKEKILIHFGIKLEFEVNLF